MSEKAENRRLVVIWSSRDPEVATNMVFMYTKNSKIKGWWEDVCLVVWGPSASLLAEDQALQVELEELRIAGVQLRACKACADRYGVSDILSDMGIEVTYMGAPLTEHLKAGDAVLTF